MGTDVNSDDSVGSPSLQVPLIKHGLVGTSKTLAIATSVSFLLFIVTLCLGMFWSSIPRYLILLPFFLVFLLGISLTVMQFTGQLEVHTKEGILTLKNSEVIVTKGEIHRSYDLFGMGLTLFIDYRGYEGEWLMAENRDLYTGWHNNNGRGSGDRNSITIKNGNQTLFRHYFFLSSEVQRNQLEEIIETWGGMGVVIKKTGKKWK